MSFASWLYSFCTLLGFFLTSLSIYVILTRSSQEMKLYKYCLLKLAICDLTFSIFLSIVLRPDVLLPLPGAAIKGICVYFGRIGGLIGLCATVVSGMTIFTAINDCCYARAMFVFDRQSTIAFIFSWRGFAVVVLINVLYAALVVPPIFLALLHDEVFIKLAESTGRSLKEEYEENVVFVGFDLSWKLIPLSTVLSGGLFLLHLCNFIASWLTLQRLNIAKEHMSRRTFQQHRMLTIMLVCQNLYPILAISVPCLFLGGVAAFDVKFVSTSDIIIHASSLGLVLYSAVSSGCNFYFVRPYREFLRQKLRSVPVVRRFVKNEVTFVMENSNSRSRTG